MAKREAPLNKLQDYLPPDTYPMILQYLNQYRVHLTVARERKSILGDYRHQTNGANHRISVNGNLNPFAFLITLIHELAHLLAFEQYGNRILAHGQEWKGIYGGLLDHFLQSTVFPADIRKELLQSLKNPAASSCAEDRLLRVLRRYDALGASASLLEELPPNALFRISDGRVFQRGQKLRKRYQCKDVNNGRLYLFSPVYEVERLQ